ncbi:MAG: cytochrome c [Actinomycetota bacterium]
MIDRRAAGPVLLLAAALVVSACTSGTNTGSTLVPPLTPGGTAADPVPPTPQLDAVRVEEGEALYGQYCSSCHGADLSGDPEWKTPNADGSYRPPPHDSSGHTWHHSDGLLLTITRDGSDFPESRMPSFGATLTDDEIAAIFEFIKASWGPEERDIQWRVTWNEENREQS